LAIVEESVEVESVVPIASEVLDLAIRQNGLERKTKSLGSKNNFQY